MRTVLFALSLLAVSVGQAQKQNQFPVPNTNTTLSSQFALFDNCPVGFRAQQRASGETIWTIALEDAGKPASSNPASPGNIGVHVELNTHGKSSIQKAEFAVFYVAPGARMLPIAESVAPATQRKTFKLFAREGESQKLGGDLLVGAAAGITRVYLLSLTYADGTLWIQNNFKPCGVEPDRFILVDAR